MDRITEKDLTPQMRREMDRLQMEWYYLGLQLQELVDFEMRKKILEDRKPIRTYNFQRNEVVDHRSGVRANLKKVLNGALNLLR